MVAARRRCVRGLVVSDSMDKTIVVRAERLVLHPVYKKYVRKFTRYYAHDEENQAHAGDTVEISQTRPLSKTKRWRLYQIVRSSRGTLEHETAAAKTGAGTSSVGESDEA